MEILITGYQYGDDMSYIGTYTFDGNLDRWALHLPPKTTLKAPPANLPVDQEAVWDGNDWTIRHVAMSWLISPPPGVVNGD